MNNDIVILREAIKKIIPMLAGKGLVVTQMGTQAYVQPHPVTGLPWRVNIPLLPDNAEPEFVTAIQGFVDHEVAHVLFTDFLYKARDKSKRLHNLHNIIEDTMIERLMGEEFPGSKRNIAKLGEFFVKNITGPAIRRAQTRQEEFDYLIVPMTRALAGHQVFQDWMDDNGHWDHELVKAFMGRFSQASKDKMPLLETTEQTYEIALELEAILYPPPPPAPPQPQPPEEEQSDEQEQNDGSDQQSDGEDDKDHSDEKQTGDGEGKGEREHTEDNEKASGGDGESDEEEKEDDAGEGEDEGAGKGKEAADEESNDDASGDSDELGDLDSAGDEEPSEDSGSTEGDADDEPGDGDEAAGETSDEEGVNDDANDADGSGEPSNDDNDERDAEGEPSDDDAQSSPGGSDEEVNDGEAESQAGDQGETEETNDHADEPDAEGSSDVDGAASENDDTGEEEGSGVDLSNVAIEQTEDEQSGQDTQEGENDLEVAGIGYDPNQNPFSEMSEDALDEKDLSSALVKIIVKEAIAACRASDYTIFTREYDVIKTLEVPENFNSKHIVELEDETRSLTGVMQKDIERMMAAQSRVFNVAGQRSGRLNSSGLHRLTAGDARVFSRREEIRAKDTAVALLSDCSGSMKGKPMATALSAAYALASVLERCNIPSECMGFTTASMWGNDSVLSEDRIKQFQADHATETAQSKMNFSRIYPIYMPIFKEFHERINSEVKRRFAYQRKHQPHMGGNIDGESLEYAAMRLAKRKEKRKVIIVLSDGFPAGADNDDEHLKYMVGRLTNMGFDLVGIGIKSDAVARFYDNYLILNSVEELPRAVMGELKKILTK